MERDQQAATAGASTNANEERTGGGIAKQIEQGQHTTGLRAGTGPSAEQMAAERVVTGHGGHADESVAGIDDKALYERFPELSHDELRRLAILEPGAKLEQGGTYLDLNDLYRGPFTAYGDEAAAAGQRIVAKRDTDFELWNRLTTGKPRPME